MFFIHYSTVCRIRDNLKNTAFAFQEDGCYNAFEHAGIMPNGETVMKVLITTDLYTTNTNGVVTSIRNLADELRAMGHTVRILTFSETKESRRAKDVYYLPSASLKRIYPNLRMPLKYTTRFMSNMCHIYSTVKALGNISCGYFLGNG